MDNRLKSELRKILGTHLEEFMAEFEAWPDPLQHFYDLQTIFSIQEIDWESTLKSYANSGHVLLFSRQYDLNPYSTWPSKSLTVVSQAFEQVSGVEATEDQMYDDEEANYVNEAILSGDLDRIVTHAGVTWLIHGKNKCGGQSCPFHKPSDHLMVKWPIIIRGDRRGLVERLCWHGIGHPDPDSLEYFKNYTDRPESDIHGCDTGCHTGQSIEGDSCHWEDHQEPVPIKEINNGCV